MEIRSSTHSTTLATPVAPQNPILLRRERQPARLGPRPKRPAPHDPLGRRKPPPRHRRQRPRHRALELDNGDVERIIRDPAIGRKNWLFAGSDEGGKRAAILLSVIKTAERAGVDLRAYIHDVLVKIAGGWPMSRLDELLPKNWAAAAAAEGH